MPLRYIRARVPRVTVDDALNIAILSASTTQQLANLSQFPAVSTAAGILLAIFQTIQNIQTNKNDCYRLARRCLALLVDIKEQMDGRWDDAPESLLKALRKLEQTLESIREYMRGEAENKWHNRLMRKSTIDDALLDYNAALDDATRSFQIATLINIHYAVGDRMSRGVLSTERMHVAEIAHETPNSIPTLSLRNVPAQITDIENLSSSPVHTARATAASLSFLSSIVVSTKISDEFVIVSPQSESLHVFAEPPDDPKPDEYILDHRGFRRYHQSELVLKGRSRIKEGWWAGATEVSADGRKSLVKRYDGARQNATKNWLRDVKILQNVFHPNLPQIIGYSHEENPTPFILLANVQTRLPQALVLSAIKNDSLASCVTLLVRFYKETLDAALYLQRQLNLTDSKTQDYVEHANFRIDAEQTLVMGLPPPEVDRIESYRNFGLAHSVKNVYLQLLPNRGYAKQPYDPADTTVDSENQKKLNHLAVLVQTLLPSSADTAVVFSRLKALLGDDEEEEPEDPRQLTLHQIRTAALETKNALQTWRQNTVPAYKYAVGDFGYFPRGRDFESFTVLCNVLQEQMVSLDVVDNVEGNQWSGERQTLQPFSFPTGVSGWTVVVPPGTKQNLQVVHERLLESPNRAWRYLLDHGKSLAKAHGVDPQDLILVTKVGVDMRLYVQDLRQTHHHAVPSPRMSAFRPHSFALQHLQPLSHGRSAPAFEFPGFHAPFPPEQPAVLYLFTAMERDHEPYWSETPFYAPLPKGTKPPELSGRCWAGLERTYGYLNYVQLHAEDFGS